VTAATQATGPAGNEPTLARVLDVRRVGGVATHSFRGAAAASTSARMFGGHAMAQALLAAGRTVADSRLPASLHCVLPRPGDAVVDCDLEVEIVRDGHAFATRRVGVTQAGSTIAQVSTQWHAGEECSMTFDDVVEPPPRPAAQPLPYPAPGVATAAFDLRWADDAHGRVLWFRPRDPLIEGRNIQAALAIYVSDLWLHRPIALTGWSCLRSTAVAAQPGRAVVTADLRTEEGTALASFTQAVSLRDRPAPSSKSSGTARSAP
jgi:acyl-CoA thioesterase II